MATWNECNATIGVSSGKWYWEVLFVSTAELQGWIAGVRTTRGQVIDSSWSRGAWNAEDDGYAYGVWDDGTKTINGSMDSGFMSALSGGDIIGFLLDLDSGTTTFKVYVNNSLAGTLQSGLQAGQSWNPGIALANPYSGSDSIAIMNFGQDSSFAGQKTAQGNQDDNSIGDFYYDVPAGYLALCTSNLPDPEIADPTEHFNTVLYTGNQTTNAITGVGFQPDWLWVKNRTTSGDYPVMVDAVRGRTEVISSASTSAEWTDSTAVTSFDSDGFTLGNATTDWNRTSGSFVAWNWKGDGVAGGTLNEEGTIDSQVNANTTAGFSIIGYTGTAAVGTVGHGLSQAPELAIFKCRDSTTTWYVNATEISDGSEKPLELDSVSSLGSAFTGYWNDTDPGASLITLGDYSGLNSTGANIIYAFHSVEGFSKIGAYEGNANADGTFVYTGFRPAYVLCRRYDSGAGWHIFDNKRAADYNVIDVRLEADNSDAENSSSSPYLDLLSNGFKFRSTFDNINAGSCLYMAFAETPFKTANAR